MKHFKQMDISTEKKYRLINYNFKLILFVIAAMIMGSITICSVRPDFLTKQLIGVSACIIGMIVVSLIDYDFYLQILYGTLCHQYRPVVSGSCRRFRWRRYRSSSMVLYIRFVHHSASEFAKIILILCTAVFLEKNYENLNTPKVLAKLAVFLAVPVGLIVAEPDLSTSICVMATLFIIIFVGGLSLKLIGIMILVLVPAFGGFIWYIQQDNLPQFLKTYQINRILGHIYGSEYGASSDQQDNSVMAIGSGQLSGKGINNSTVATVKDTNLISEQQTDFIFSAVGEELGFIGSVIIIAILCLIVLQCIRVARHAKDKKGMYIATGIGALVAFQTFINIGVATALLPNTGLPLPFISYGLSSLVSMSAGIGLVLNINLQKKKY